MRKLLLLLSICFSTAVWSQEFIEPKYVYAEILGMERFLSKKVSITIDYGQIESIWQDARLRTEDGKIRVFNSMVDAMNFMGAMGWEFQQAYVITVGNQNVYHWLLRKEYSQMPDDYKDSLKETFVTTKNKN